MDTIKAYVARAMTGRIKRDVVKEAKADTWLLHEFGITALDPVAEEKVKATKQKLDSSYEEMTRYWRRDKQMIREAHLVMDMTPWMKSEGVAHEIGYARYFLWKPVVRVYNEEHPVPSRGSVAYFEDDVLAPNVYEAAAIIQDTWGTPWKRFVWRAAMYNRSVVKAFLYRLKEWWTL